MVEYLKGIESYKSLITGEKITSRQEHNKHLAKHGAMEVSNNQEHIINCQKIRENREKESVNFNKQVTKEFIQNYDPKRKYTRAQWREVANRIREDLARNRKR